MKQLVNKSIRSLHGTDQLGGKGRWVLSLSERRCLITDELQEVQSTMVLRELSGDPDITRFKDILYWSVNGWWLWYWPPDWTPGNDGERR